MRRAAFALLLQIIATDQAAAGLNQWTTGGPNRPFDGPARLQALAIDPATPSNVYAAGDGIFKSIDGGAHWLAVNSPEIPTFDVFALAIDPQTPTTVYAASSASGIIKSIDGGAHWNPTGLSGQAIALAVDPKTPTTLYAALFVQGVFKSTDGGAHWTQTDAGISGGLINSTLVLDPKTPSTLYIATFGGGVFKSLDGGAHWNSINTGLGDPSLNVYFSLAVDPQVPANLYLGTDRGVFRSTDGGNHWDASNMGFPGFGIGWIAALAVDPQISTIVYAGTSIGGVFRSTDGGESWSPFNAGLGIQVIPGMPASVTAPGITALQVSPTGSCVHAAVGLVNRGDFLGVFGLTIRPDPCAPPLGLTATVSQPTFSAGQSLVTTVGGMSGGLAAVADFYVGVIAPDSNTIAFLTSTGNIAVGSLADRASFHPFAVGVSLATPFLVTQPNFFSYRWAGAEPRGRYFFFALAVEAGTLADPDFSREKIFDVAGTSFLLE